MSHSQTPDHPEFADWDAAYVLGALSVDERRRYERHLADCPTCTAAVAAIAGMPGLLGQVAADDIRPLVDDPFGAATVADGSSPPDDLLPRLERAQQRHRSRRRRRALWAGIAAAAVFGVGAIVLPQVWPGDSTPAVATTLTSVSEVPLTADVRLFTEQWGTRIEMNCSYDHPGDDPYGADRRRDYALYVIGQAGEADEVSTWTATAGSTASTSGTTRLGVDQIATVQVRSLTDGRVLLAADLP